MRPRSWHTCGIWWCLRKLFGHLWIFQRARERLGHFPVCLKPLHNLFNWCSGRKETSLMIIAIQLLTKTKALIHAIEKKLQKEEQTPLWTHVDANIYWFSSIWRMSTGAQLIGFHLKNQFSLEIEICIFKFMQFSLWSLLCSVLNYIVNDVSKI